MGFEFSMELLGAGSDPIGLVAPWRFKTHDSQLEKSNSNPVPFNVHICCDFQMSCQVFLTQNDRVFGPSASKFTFAMCSVGTQQLRDEKLRRFMVVSPREVPYLTFS